ncbi:MAG: NAD(P)-dependent oxidoreductase [Enterobacterales bacterium]|nr:NAD(P)-dependent oxidoreductase [Enterobacterales bacterium]
MSLGLSNSTTDGTLSKPEIEANFKDLHPLLSQMQAQAESSRCLYCYDAPCIKACPTGINIPTFIHQIATDNVTGSAKTILSENIMGGTCARACPTEVLCEQDCVLNESLQQPVKIGQLQRYAVDHLLGRDVPHPFSRKPSSGKTIAVVGAGPAGLSCAHRAAMLGHEVTIYEAKSKAGGLNEYGLAAYKMADNFAQKEIEFLLDIGGISIQYNCGLNQQVMLSDLRQQYDAVFIAIGLSKVNQLNIEGEDSAQVLDAIDLIEDIRQADDLSQISCAENVVVIGAGNTAIDAAIQSKRLGAKNVTLVYRRDEAAMSATRWEVDLARLNQVKMIFCATPVAYHAETQRLSLAKTQIKDGKVELTSEHFEMDADRVLKAIGQKLDSQKLDSQQLDSQKQQQNFDLKHQKIAVKRNYMTSLQGVFAGGDCIDGDDLTVEAVQDGKVSGAGDRSLSNGTGVKHG